MSPGFESPREHQEKSMELKWNELLEYIKNNFITEKTSAAVIERSWEEKGNERISGMAFNKNFDNEEGNCSFRAVTDVESEKCLILKKMSELVSIKGSDPDIFIQTSSTPPGDDGIAYETTLFIRRSSFKRNDFSIKYPNLIPSFKYLIDTEAVILSPNNPGPVSDMAPMPEIARGHLNHSMLNALDLVANMDERSDFTVSVRYADILALNKEFGFLNQDEENEILKKYLQKD